MSLIKKALVFKTDEERLVWFESLSPEDQEEIRLESMALVNGMIEAFIPVAKAYLEWWYQFFDRFGEVVSAFAQAQAQANTACTRTGEEHSVDTNR